MVQNCKPHLDADLACFTELTTVQYYIIKTDIHVISHSTIFQTNTSNISELAFQNKSASTCNLFMDLTWCFTLIQYDFLSNQSNISKLVCSILLHNATKACTLSDMIPDMQKSQTRFPLLRFRDTF